MSKDHWSAKSYNSAASFVPQLTSTVISYLDVQSTDHILDIGCGDGQLTAQIAHRASSGRVLGLDSSHSFIQSAQKTHTSDTCTFQLQDCTHLDQHPPAVDGCWDKVFSNAAMHWILRRPDTRASFFGNVYRALKPGGTFVFEQGGAGNVAEIHAAVVAALAHAGLSFVEAREAMPWFFPSVELMRRFLGEAGFEVEVCEIEYRPTKLTLETADGSGGLEGWVRLMCAQALDAVADERRDGVVKEVCEIVDSVITRPEDGSRWIGYTRLRGVARKK
jgi:trans-aconitate methyltransferase